MYRAIFFEKKSEYNIENEVQKLSSTAVFPTQNKRVSDHKIAQLQHYLARIGTDKQGRHRIPVYSAGSSRI